ncbi:homoserine kinase [Brevundimonas sp.]|uniref:homoserine kinase n=1 Tax=Brevundimonas sp. TaxID=1871086 RepID=UPI0035B098D9
MAVFTPVEPADAEPFIRRFGAGRLRELTPIAEGIQNTNYRVETDEGRFVLTLFEARTQVATLPFCLDLTDHLATRGLPTARTLRDADGRNLGELNDRPAALLQWLEGGWQRDPSLADHTCAGAMLARLHLATNAFNAERPNPVGPAARRTLFDACALRATGADRAILDRCAPWVEADPGRDLPRRPIHADYFPDNVLFKGDAISGVIDFYYACTDAPAYDLAIALSAWGFDAEGAALPAALEAFQAGYESLRPLDAAERAALPALGAVAATRFTLTRLYDQVYHDPSALVAPKDPAPFVRRLDWWTRMPAAA